MPARCEERESYSRCGLSLLTAGKHCGGCSMESYGLRAEGEFLVLFGLCREQLHLWLLDFILDGYLHV